VGKRTLPEIVTATPVLQQLERGGRLLWYDLSTSPIRHGSAPIVEATYFSAEAALNLLAAAGARYVRSLGIDGGSSYSAAFEDLRDTTLLANGRTSFDLQFEGFARTINRTGIDFSPLDQPAPARVVSAFKPDEVLPVAVLHHSIRRRASLTVDTVAIPDGSDFSAHNGPVVVVSPRAQFQTDLRKLWGTAVLDGEAAIPADAAGGGPALILAGPGLDHVLPTLMSCIRDRAPLATLAQGGAPVLRPSLAKAWNPGWWGGPEGNVPVLYYAPDGSEPWLSRKHPVGHIWVGDLLDAVAQGHVRPDLVAREVALGHARPSLLYQVEHGLEEPLLLPARARYLDRNFRPAARQTGRTPTIKWRPLLAAFGRQLWRWSRGLKAGVAAPR
jgi:hypothetical protein